MTGDLYVGIDIGSTYLKALAWTGGSQAVAEARRSTPWRGGDDGQAELDPSELIAMVEALIEDVSQDRSPRAVGVSGMAEAGVLVDGPDVAPAPIFAWFDSRGEAEIMATPKPFRAQFPGRTGLPLSRLASIAKLLYIRGQGVNLSHYQWLNVPEFVVHALGGAVASESSLASRTGLLDQDTGSPWDEALNQLGVCAGFVPEIRSAGSPWGRHARTGAVLTVAGHDHQVASVAAGVLREDQLYDSIGTAEALVRPVIQLVPFDQRASLAEAGINVGQHVIAGTKVMLAGAKTGLLLRRVLQLVGVNDRPGRDALDLSVLGLATGAGDAVRVSGARNDDGLLRIVTDADGLSPAVLFAAALRHTQEEVDRLLSLMYHTGDSPRHTVVSGGWSQMESVRASRRSALPRVTFSSRSEDTAFGAALFAAFATSDAQDFTQYASSIDVGMPTT